MSISKLFLTIISSSAAISGVTTTLFVINNLKSGKNYDSAISYVKDKAKLIKEQILNLENNKNNWENQVYKFVTRGWNCSERNCTKKVSNLISKSDIFINNYEEEISKLKLELKKLDNFLKK